jgi:hypothetical protein
VAMFGAENKLVMQGRVGIGHWGTTLGVESWIWMDWQNIAVPLRVASASCYGIATWF